MTACLTVCAAHPARCRHVIVKRMARRGIRWCGTHNPIGVRHSLVIHLVRMPPLCACVTSVVACMICALPGLALWDRRSCLVGFSRLLAVPPAPLWFVHARFACVAVGCICWFQGNPSPVLSSPCNMAVVPYSVGSKSWLVAAVDGGCVYTSGASTLRFPAITRVYQQHAVANHVPSDRSPGTLPARRVPVAQDLRLSIPSTPPFPRLTSTSEYPPLLPSSSPSVYGLAQLVQRASRKL